MSDEPQAAVYIRVSTDEQGDHGISLESQEAVCRDEAARQGYHVASVYKDVQSGREDNRPAFEKMMAAAEAKSISAVVVYDLSRLNRFDVIEALQLVRRLDAAGCRLLCVNDPIDRSTPIGELFFIIKAGINSAESKQTSQRVKMNMRRMVETGKWAGGHPSYGWIYTEDGILQHPEQALIVVRIFQEYADGESTNAIARRLGREGIPTPGSAKGWCYQSVRKILENQMYIGVQRFGEWTGLLNVVPIVPADLHARVTARLNTNTFRKGRNGVLWEWSGMMRCGLCEGQIIFNTRKDGADRVRCRNMSVMRYSKNEKACSLRTGRAKDAADLARYIARRIGEASPPLAPPEPPTGLREELRRLAQRIEDANYAFFDLGSINRDRYEAIVRECRTKQDAINVETEAAPVEAGHAMIEIAKRWTDVSMGERNQLLRQIVEAVALTPEAYVVKLRATGWESLPQHFVMYRDGKDNGQIVER